MQRLRQQQRQLKNEMRGLCNQAPSATSTFHLWTFGMAGQEWNVIEHLFSWNVIILILQTPKKRTINRAPASTYSTDPVPFTIPTYSNLMNGPNIGQLSSDHGNLTSQNVGGSSNVVSQSHHGWKHISHIYIYVMYR